MNQNSGIASVMDRDHNAKNSNRWRKPLVKPFPRPTYRPCQRSERHRHAHLAQAEAPTADAAGPKKEVSAFSHWLTPVVWVTKQSSHALQNSELKLLNRFESDASFFRPPGHTKLLNEGRSFAHDTQPRILLSFRARSGSPTRERGQAASTSLALRVFGWTSQGYQGR
jgi:hypothetical protein